ncbi:peptidyl-prolyl cis-trans isomerase, cyclophilin-type [Bacteriovorax sp. BSW11_IV]|uniref:peptidylprolyl isomerase n=1 Tax=Bacteriovorax sp. BSW11_IV TaxID=1353529 RepID=UPI00038A486B|nr:peptidylprolyl isomerase [Bacteriovorax sp. BSW11_IV]EQC48567.1 peptidyl-prolyl cis-trans isomerase, cyclophilin-type [Bacteriovorax sp. BSW11_IV]
MFGLGGTKKSEYKEELERIYANFQTNMGDFEVELYAKECPETVWNFVNLAEGRQETKKEGPYYDGLTFHRVISGFVIQGGCPDGSGMGGPGYKFKDECTPALRHDSEGILSMANAGPGTNGSQFFITLAPTPHLDGRHTVFGKVINGLDIVRKIGVTNTNYMDKPVSDVVMEKVTIVRK